MSVDHVLNPSAHHNIVLGEHSGMAKVSEDLARILGDLQGAKVKLIANVAGGWAGGSICDVGTDVENALFHCTMYVRCLCRVDGEGGADVEDECGILITGCPSSNQPP